MRAGRRRARERAFFLSANSAVNNWHDRRSYSNQGTVVEAKSSLAESGVTIPFGAQADHSASL